jgi:hypothetical protein
MPIYMWVFNTMKDQEISHSCKQTTTIFRFLLLCITKSVMKTAFYSTAMTHLKMGQCCHTNLEGHNTMQLLLEWLRAVSNPHVILFPSHDHMTVKPTWVSISHFLHEYTLLRHSPHRQCSKCFKMNSQAYQKFRAMYISPKNMYKGCMTISLLNLLHIQPGKYT